MNMLCDYCNRPAQFVDSKVIYGKSYGMVYYCEPCDAYVGVHKGTDKPLGRLANKELRDYKKRAHAAFDPLWRAVMERDGVGKGEARGRAYKWLAKELHKTPKECHIGMFDVDDCSRVIAVCKRFAR